MYYDGTSFYFRTDGKLTADITGNAGTATKLATARNIALTGAVTGSASFDGSANASINTTMSAVDASAITSGTIAAERLPIAVAYGSKPGALYAKLDGTTLYLSTSAIT